MIMTLSLLTIPGQAFAHHGTAAFDMEKVTTIKGTVVKFMFMNPHSLIYVDVVGDKGEIEHWVAEESSNNHLSRIGWSNATLKIGQPVTVIGHRARNGAFTLELQCEECSVSDSEGKPIRNQ
jgi:Family of unknown function (DUF6152)